MIKYSELLRKQITRIPNNAKRNSNFLTLQTSEFQNKIPTGIFGIENGIGNPLTMGVPEIGTKNQNSQPRVLVVTVVCGIVCAGCVCAARPCCFGRLTQISAPKIGKTRHVGGRQKGLDETNKTITFN
jgi:hypothetical protein